MRQEPMNAKTKHPHELKPGDSVRLDHTGHAAVYGRIVDVLPLDDGSAEVIIYDPRHDNTFTQDVAADEGLYCA